MNYTWLYKIKYSDRNNYEKIYNNRYNSDSTFQYDFSIGKSPVFVVVTTELLQIISDIQKLDKEFMCIKDTLPTIALDSYKRKCLIDEVKQTNELEGVVSSRKEIGDILDNKNTKNKRLIGIVQKYSMLSSQSDIPLSTCADIRTLYNELVLDEIRMNDEKNIPDGDIFRSDKVYIKNGNEVIHTGLYPESSIIETLSAFLAAMNNSNYNDFINIAVFHYMFGYIHPFYDGNGRMSRFICSCLLSEIVDSIVSYRLAYTIKKDVDKYYKMFKLTNDPLNKGDLTPFTIYFLNLIKDIFVDLISEFNDYKAILCSYLERVKNSKLNNDEKLICNILVQSTLFDSPGLIVDYLSEILSKSDSTVRKIIKKLEDRGIVTHERTRPYRYSIVLEKIQ